MGTPTKRIVETVEGFNVVDLFPYDIKDRDNFYFRDHPDYHPHTSEYKKYWADQWKNIIEGLWVNDNGTWVYMFPKLYFHCNLFSTEMQGSTKGHREIGRPTLRDNEWIIFTYLFCCQGFSGFENDDDYTCNDVVRKIQDGEELTMKDKKQITPNCYKKGTQVFKKYVDPWEYLTVTYLLDDNRGEPLGLPLYENRVSNFCLMGSRTSGKTVCMSSDMLHEWITGGIKYAKDLKKAKDSKIEMFIGSADANYITNFMSKAKTGNDRLPGAYNKYGLKKPSPFHKESTGNWVDSRSKVQQYFRKADGSTGGTDSKITKGVIQTNKVEGGVGQRPVRVVVDEVGLVAQVADFHYANEEALAAEGIKHGIAVYTGTSGNLEKIQQAKEIFTYTEKFEVFGIPNYWEEPTKKIGLFIPAYYTDTDFKDPQGNTQIVEALSFVVLDERKRKTQAGEDTAIKNILNRPLKPSEMFVAAGTNIFPQDNIIDRIQKLEAGIWKRKAKIGELVYTDYSEHKVKFIETGGEPIISLDVKKHQRKGKVVIYEKPRYEEKRFVGKSLYKVIYDTVATDGETISFASILVYKGIPAKYEQDEMFDTIVAEWIGTVNDINAIHEIALKLATYYNTRVLYEANVGNMSAYCRVKNKIHLLQRTPWKTIESVLEGKPNRSIKYGIKMTTQLKKAMILQANKWSRDAYYTDEEGRDIMNVNRLYSLRLLYELNFYTTTGNFDHFSALLVLMVWLTSEGVEPTEAIDEVEEINAFDELSMIARQNMYQ